MLTLGQKASETVDFKCKKITKENQFSSWTDTFPPKTSQGLVKKIYFESKFGPIWRYI